MTKKEAKHIIKEFAGVNNLVDEEIDLIDLAYQALDKPKRVRQKKRKR